MSKIMPIATHVYPDEACSFLAERNLQGSGNKGHHRYQILKVVRGDRIGEFRWDMGPTEEWPVPEFSIIGGYRDAEGRGHIFETVGSMRDLADAQRLKSDWLDVGLNYFAERDRQRILSLPPKPLYFT